MLPYDAWAGRGSRKEVQEGIPITNSHEQGGGGAHGDAQRGPPAGVETGTKQHRPHRRRRERRRRRHSVPRADRSANMRSERPAVYRSSRANRAACAAGQILDGGGYWDLRCAGSGASSPDSPVTGCRDSCAPPSHLEKKSGRLAPRAESGKGGGAVSPTRALKQPANTSSRPAPRSRRAKVTDTAVGMNRTGLSGAALAISETGCPESLQDEPSDRFEDTFSGWLGEPPRTWRLQSM